MSERLKVNTAGRVERIVLIWEDISQLVADKLRSANLFVNIPVGVTVDPVLRPASLDEIILIGNKGTVDAAPFEIRRWQLEGRQMVRHHNSFGGLGLIDRISQESHTSLMLLVELVKSQRLSVEKNPMEIYWKRFFRFSLKISTLMESVLQ